MPTQAPPVVDPSTRRLSDVARHVVVPTGIVDTLWFEVEQQCAEWGDEFDAWQDGLGQLALGLREDGYYAATIGGITLSIPRQVAKTFLVSRIIFAICILYPNTTVLWTAHRTRTSTQTFEKLKGLTRNPVVKSHLARNRSDGIRSANGEQEIRFKNGSVIMFGAREQGFGRGFDEVDIEVFDEAQILTEKALDDMIAATNQSRFPHGALLFYMGTPPTPTDPGEVFTNRRRKALAAKDPGTVYAEHGDALYVECSADPNVGRNGGPALDDLEQVAIANPSYPHRTPPVSIARLRENLGSDESWRREGLGVWDDFEATKQVIASGDWARCGIEVGAVPTGHPDYYSLSISAERVGYIGVAFQGEEKQFVDLAEAGRVDDSRKLVDWFAERRKTQPKLTVAIDTRDPAAALVNDLRAARIKVNVTTRTDSARASVGLAEAVIDGHLEHVDQPAVREALLVARKKPVDKAGLWEFDPDDDIAALRAITLARYGLTFKKRKRAGQGRTGSRRAGVVSS